MSPINFQKIHQLKTMRKFLSILILLLCCAACSKDNDTPPEISGTVRDIWQALNGTFIGEYTTFGNPYKTEEITFTPYLEPVEILPIYEKKCLAFGSARIKIKYSSLDFDGVYYYSLDEMYSGAIPTISFYEYDAKSGNIINSADKRNIRIINASSIKMWSYGLTEDGSGNVVIYTKH